MVIKDVLDAARPVFTMWKLCGLCQYTTEGLYNSENRKVVYKTSKKVALTVIVVLVIWMVLYVKYVKITNNFYSYVSLSQFVSIMLQNICLLVYSHVKRRNIESMFSILLRIERMLNKLPNNRFPCRKIWTQMVCYIALQTLFTVCVFISSYVLIGINDGARVFILVYYTGVIFSFNAQYMILVHLLACKEFYLNINEFQTRNTMTARNNFKTNLDIYEQLEHLSNAINKEFEPLIVFKNFTEFIIILISIFYTTRGIVHTSIQPFGAFVMVLSTVSLWVIVLSVSITTVPYLFESISAQKKIATHTICDTIYPSDTLSPRTADLLLLKRQITSQHSVCGLYPLNSTFIFTVIAGTVSYLIYLMQFSTSTKGKPF